jgi:hypothetical protein
MRVLIPTIMYGRHQVFDVFAQGVRELRRAYPEITFEVLVVGTGDSKACQKHRYEYYRYKNEPLADKANYRLSLCKDRADFYLFLGSDDIMRPDTFETYLKAIEEGADYIAPLDLCFWYKKKMYYSHGYGPAHPRHGEPLAVGRMVSNELLNRVRWSLWTSGRNKNIDREAYEKLIRFSKHKHFYQLCDISGLILDIKTSDNLSGFQESWTYLGRPRYYLSDKICKLLSTLPQ